MKHLKYFLVGVCLTLIPFLITGVAFCFGALLIYLGIPREFMGVIILFIVGFSIISYNVGKLFLDK